MIHCEYLMYCFPQRMDVRLYTNKNCAQFCLFNMICTVLLQIISNKIDIYIRVPVVEI